MTSEIASYEKKIADVEQELHVLLGGETRDTRAISVKSGELHTLTEELNALNQQFELRVKNREQALKHYNEEKSSIEERLETSRHQLVELEEKLKRKKGQMNDNIGSIGKK
jgi:predicted  nucleic acid-binding Zn-ribbon protein